jgi:phosphoribosyl-ATP pyrophosphohydrolase
MACSRVGHCKRLSRIVANRKITNFENSYQYQTYNKKIISNKNKIKEQTTKTKLCSGAAKETDSKKYNSIIIKQF